MDTRKKFLGKCRYETILKQKGDVFYTYDGEDFNVYDFGSFWYYNYNGGKLWDEWTQTDEALERPFDPEFGLYDLLKEDPEYFESIYNPITVESFKNEWLQFEKVAI